MTQTIKNLPAMQKPQVQSLGLKDPLEKGMATCSSILAWRIPWTEEPGELQSLGSQTVGKEWSNWVCTNTPYVLWYCNRVKGNSDCSSSEAFQTNEERIWLNFIKIMKNRTGLSFHVTYLQGNPAWSVQCSVPRGALQCGVPGGAIHLCGKFQNLRTMGQPLKLGKCTCKRN